MKSFFSLMRIIDEIFINKKPLKLILVVFCIFTYHLMKVLMDESQYKPADIDENGELSLYEVYTHVYQLGIIL